MTGVRRVNLNRLELDQESDRDGYRWRRARVGEQLGAEAIGGSVYELADGECAWPYHFHHATEEWGIVLDGTPTLRGPGGERELRRGEVVCFRAGPDGAHQLRGPGRVLIVSTKRAPDLVEYPDSGKVGVRPDGRNFLACDAVDYWEGE